MHAAIKVMDLDRLAVADQAGGGLEEEQRVIGRTDLARIARRIVERNATDLRRPRTGGCQ
jgi:hypothetical protein